MEQVKIAVIPCAGKGTRMQPLSFFMPKEMVPIGPWPIIHHSVAEVAGIGCDEIVLILSPGKDVLRDYAAWVSTLDGFSHLTFSFVIQEEPTGIADALLLSEGLVAGRARARWRWLPPSGLRRQGTRPYQSAAPCAQVASMRFKSSSRSATPSRNMSDAVSLVLSDWSCSLRRLYSLSTETASCTLCGG